MRRGRRARGSLLHVVHSANDLDRTRLGYSVSRRVGNAVTRNRVRRRLRAIVSGHRFAGGHDVVLLAQPTSAAASFEALSAEVDAQLRRAKLEAPPASDDLASIAADETLEASPGVAARTVLWLIRGYQRTISPSQPAACRYEPTCSVYGATAIKRHGAARGSWLATKRLLRCRPGSKGGYDPVPPKHTDDRATP